MYCFGPFANFKQKILTIFSKACAADPALGKTVTIDFTQGKSSYFTEETGTSITYSEGNGAVFTIDSTGVAQTIYTTDYIFFGKVEFTLRAANGTGIVSSFVMESDDLDEIDLVRHSP